MLSLITIQSKENVRSAIVNCLCPECGGVIELHSNQFRCLGRCGKQWRAIWGKRTLERHPNTATRQPSAISQEPAMTACTRTDGLGIPVAFKMVSKPHTTSAIVDKRATRASRG